MTPSLLETPNIYAFKPFWGQGGGGVRKEVLTIPGPPLAKNPGKGAHSQQGQLVRTIPLPNPKGKKGIPKGGGGQSRRQQGHT